MHCRLGLMCEAKAFESIRSSDCTCCVCKCVVSFVHTKVTKWFFLLWTEECEKSADVCCLQTPPPS